MDVPTMMITLSAGKEKLLANGLDSQKKTARNTAHSKKLLNDVLNLVVVAAKMRMRLPT